LNLQALFPGIIVFPNYHLYDRAGDLEDLNIISQSGAIKKYLNDGNKKVIGCAGGLPPSRDRTSEWLHINPNGDMFMCCDDFSFETIYENINEKSLKDIWFGQQRQDMIAQARDSICLRCSAAVWG
jgi:MoaA/NifB/PqqE/SkfB family radical SAM enzyme